MSGISKSQVSRLIDDKIQSFLDRPLEGDWPYLWLDATYLKARQAGRIVSVAVTVAVAVNDQGRREVLGMAIGASEAETFWTGFLRGLKLVIADDHKGLKAAATRILGATAQRCRVHFMRNLPAHAGKQGRRVVSASPLRRNRVCPGRCRQCRRTVAPGRRPTQAQGAKARRPHGRGPARCPRLHELPQGAPPEVAFDQPARTPQRRDQATHHVVGIFPNENAITRLVGAILLEQNDEWAVSRRYMTLESIAETSDNLTLKLPTVAA